MSIRNHRPCLACDDRGVILRGGKRWTCPICHNREILTGIRQPPAPAPVDTATRPSPDRRICLIEEEGD